jgi:hypothetical protein
VSQDEIEALRARIAALEAAAAAQATAATPHYVAALESAAMRVTIQLHCARCELQTFAVKEATPHSKWLPHHAAMCSVCGKDYYPWTNVTTRQQMKVIREDDPQAVPVKRLGNHKWLNIWGEGWQAVGFPWLDELSLDPELSQINAAFTQRYVFFHMRDLSDDSSSPFHSGGDDYRLESEQAERLADSVIQKDATQLSSALSTRFRTALSGNNSVMRRLQLPDEEANLLRPLLDVAVRIERYSAWIRTHRRPY